jgi:hypothetical protein
METRITLLIAFFFILSSCGQFKSSDELNQEIITSLSVTENKQDTLFLGYRFGMSQEEFFTHSWDLNKEGLVLNGSGAEIVQYTDELKSRTKKSFYPVFENDKITAMPVIYTYTGWAPWNSHLTSDSLQLDLVEYIGDSLNVTFLEEVDPNTRKPIYQTLYHGQEITIMIVDHDKVLVRFLATH